MQENADQNNTVCVEYILRQIMFVSIAKMSIIFWGSYPKSWIQSLDPLFGSQCHPLRSRAALNLRLKCEKAYGL